jgi:hypothetical protein
VNTIRIRSDFPVQVQEAEIENISKVAVIKKRQQILHAESDRVIVSGTYVSQVRFAFVNFAVPKSQYENNRLLAVTYGCNFIPLNDVLF